MVFDIYRKAFHHLMQKPFRLWGLSLLCGLLASLAGGGFAMVPPVAVAISLTLEAGMCALYLNYYTRQLQPQSVDLFAGFRKDRIWRVMGGSAWALLWIFLWSLIPVVGIVFGIIRTYEYRFVPYILMTREDVKATDAIKVSKAETMGFKGRMFWADVLPAALFLALVMLLASFGYIGYLSSQYGLIALFAFLLLLVLLVYVIFGKVFYGLVRAGFYAEIQAVRGRTMKAPEEPEPPAESEAEE